MPDSVELLRLPWGISDIIVFSYLLSLILISPFTKTSNFYAEYAEDFVSKFALDLFSQNRNIKFSDKPRDNLTIECDELWSFVDRKKNEYWVWLAINRKTREIVGCYIGDRSKSNYQQNLLF